MEELSPEEHRAFLAELAKDNLRGITSSDIVCEIQKIRAEIPYEKDDLQRYFMECRLNHHLNELERRTHLNETGVRKTNREIIQTIKERIPIDTVMDWYTDVYVRNNNWTYRCPLHVDKHPSGKLYLDEGKFHCFQCQAHGDIFDCVQLCERLELIEAIKKLANYIGLEIKPFEKQPTDLDERLRQAELHIENLEKKKPTHSKYD